MRDTNAPADAAEARDALQTAGVATDDIEALEQRVEQTVDAMLETYSDYVTLDAGEQADVVVAVQDELLRYLVAKGWRDADYDVETWFDRIHDEFADPEGSHARSNVGIILGQLSVRNDSPRAVMKLANAALAERYDH